MNGETLKKKTTLLRFSILLFFSSLAIMVYVPADAPPLVLYPLLGVWLFSIYLVGYAMGQHSKAKEASRGFFC